jgi:hypothetical protein
MNARISLYRATLCIGVCLIGGGCTYRMTSASPGQVTFEDQGVPPAAPVPPAMGGTAGAVPAAPAPRNGAYAGIGRVLTNTGGTCGDPIRITNFTVNGNKVSFGSFRGTIQPSGALQMQAGPRYVYGQFTGPHFEGRFWQPQPACTYSMSLDPVGE